MASKPHLTRSKSFRVPYNSGQMENIITRSEFESACDIVDDVSGTASINHCTEEKAARLFPSDPYVEYLRWLEEYLPDPIDPKLDPAPFVFERYVKEVMELLEHDGTLYLEGYRSYLFSKTQIRTAINDYMGMAWISDHHVSEAVKRKRSRRK